LNERIRILRVIARMNMGGPAYHVALLSGRLDRNRYETLLATGRVGPGEAPLEDLAESYGVRLSFVNGLGPELSPLADLRALLHIRRIVREFRPHIVETHTAKAGFLGRLAAAAARPRPAIVHVFHGHVLEDYFDPVRTRLYRSLERWLAGKSDRLIAVSPQNMQDLVRLGIADRSKFAVVPLGLELSRFLELPLEPGSSFRDEIGARPDETVLVFIGRVVPIKRLDVLVRGLAAARRAGAAVRLAVVGDGPARRPAEELASELGVAEAVAFVGYRRDLADIVAAADLGVLASDNEGTPVSLIELGAGGRALVATRVGGVPEVLAEGCGLLVPRRDPAALGAAIARLAREPGLRRRMGQTAREHVRRRYSSDRLLADMDALYAELLKPRDA
jgi:glycosyltransferase involved in cell wall biosynthesis